MSAAAAGAHVNPFPGLRPFREDEAHLFFGRENQVDAMIDKLAATRFLAVIGTSGSGKSSLVNCGLRPALCQGLMARAGTAWRMAQFRPGNDPIGAMARALAQDGVLFPAQAATGLSLAEIVETNLRMSKLGLIDICEQAALGEGVNLLVVVDQFEELFRYRQLGGVRNAGEDAAAFVNLLLEVKEQNCRIFVVLTMRSDFLGDCTQFPGLAEAINAGQYLVPRMTRDERRAAIERPIDVGGAESASVLLTRLVNDVGDNPDQLSILQHALNRTWALWEEDSGGQGPLDLAHYEAIGTMAHALDRHAEQAYAELTTPRQQQIAEKLFKALTDKATDVRGVRRPTTLATLCALSEATEAEVAGVIDVFRDPSRSFLMPPAGEPLRPETVIDISHETLMRVWRRLDKWADEEAQSARTYRRLGEAAEDHTAGTASLWRDPELQLALDWRTRNQPNEAWASRYHRGFAAAMRFLTDSSEARDAERAERQQQRQREREAQQEKAATQAKYSRWMRWATVFSGALAAAAFAFGVVALEASETAEQKKKEAQDSLREAQVMQSRWLVNAAERMNDPSARILLALEALPDADQKIERPWFAKAQKGLIKGINDLRVLVEGRGHTEQLLSVAMTPDGSRILTGSGDKTARLWDAKGTELLQLTGHTGIINSVAMTPDGTRFLTGSTDKTARLWDDKGAVLLQLTGHTGAINSVAMTPDGSRIVTASTDRTARLWDAKGVELLRLVGHSGLVKSVAISSDGARIVTSSTDETVLLWDGGSGAEELGLIGYTGVVDSVAITPDGRRIVTGSRDGTASLWNAISGLELAQLKIEGGTVTSVAVTSKGDRIAIGSSDGTMRLWDPNDDGKLHKPLVMNGPKSAIRGVAMTSNGSRIVSGSPDAVWRLWDADPLRPPLDSYQLGARTALPTLISLAKSAVVRCLTMQERLDGALGLTPPGWCIEREKYPYATKPWKDWKAGKLVDDTDTAEKLGDAADKLLKSGDFRQALEAADLSMKFGPKVIWLSINKAHALMFLGQPDEARKAYLAHSNEKLERDLGKWNDAVLADFKALRKEGREHPLMAEIETLFKNPPPKDAPK